jgi:hypothetical protein
MTVGAARVRLLSGFNKCASFHSQDNPAQEIDGGLHGAAVQVLVIVVREHVRPDNGKQRSSVQASTHDVDRSSNTGKVRLLESEENAMITSVIRQVTAMHVDRCWSRGKDFLTYVPGAAHDQQIGSKQVKELTDLRGVDPADNHPFSARRGRVLPDCRGRVTEVRAPVGGPAGQSQAGTVILPPQPSRPLMMPQIPGTLPPPWLHDDSQQPQVVCQPSLQVCVLGIIRPEEYDAEAPAITHARP